MTDQLGTSESWGLSVDIGLPLGRKCRARKQYFYHNQESVHLYSIC